ncbi:plasmid pRiA4b ORF-3 family protein [Methylobacterium sp. NEAU 140]|uniref:plasmid pRiA4b ORF-3 family protein n=1 Tax=Methylobacterium sp. NEAU 140 TaxID=3064945 RepID=UPI00273581FF|nr:plasmid pRiA4b ORF-3 family protein [Methylobacterium sp. NEAU 140]MDP4024152.1 plasmid pRiA4b ORF-3 family protein [Methylobacterium sp. NEAU 140]
MSYVDRIARLRITLDDSMPAVWRTVEVPLTMTLKGLHEVIQAAMPFEDYHLFAFRSGDHRYALPDLEWPDPNTRNAKTTKLGTVLEDGAETFAYVYDFGDNWQHTVRVEAIGPADPAVEYPRFLYGARRAPPEDVGGTLGFEEFEKAVTKPRHREHKAMLAWYGGPFDPELVPVEIITEKMAKLARRRTLGKAAFARSRGLEQ